MAVLLITDSKIMQLVGLTTALFSFFVDPVLAYWLF